MGFQSLEVWVKRGSTVTFGRFYVESPMGICSTKKKKKKKKKKKDFVLLQPAKSKTPSQVMTTLWIRN